MSEDDVERYARSSRLEIEREDQVLGGVVGHGGVEV